METYLTCLINASEALGLRYEFLDKEKNLARVTINGAPLHFQITKTPFNTEVMASICKDKEHVYLMFKDLVPMPKTMGFLDYTIEEKSQKYLVYKSTEEIIAKIEEEFSYPLVIKKNKGSFGINVFLCYNKEQIKKAIQIIFNKESNQYDYVVLAQEHVPHHKEFRMVCFRGEAMLTYERISGNTEFNVRYWEDQKGKAKHVTDPNIINQLVSFVRPAMEMPGLDYVGFDIIMKKDGNCALLELNSGPRFDHFIEDNGNEAVVAMYKKILSKLLDDEK